MLARLFATIDHNACSIHQIRGQIASFTGDQARGANDECAEMRAIAPP
jgi:hypothetical protein